MKSYAIEIQNVASWESFGISKKLALYILNSESVIIPNKEELLKVANFLILVQQANRSSLSALRQLKKLNLIKLKYSYPNFFSTLTAELSIVILSDDSERSKIADEIMVKLG